MRSPNVGLDQFHCLVDVVKGRTCLGVVASGPKTSAVRRLLTTLTAVLTVPSGVLISCPRRRPFAPMTGICAAPLGAYDLLLQRFPEYPLARPAHGMGQIG